MLKTRKRLLTALLLLTGVGFLFAATAGFLSLKPSEKSLAQLPMLPMRSLAAGQFMYVAHPVGSSHKQEGMSILFIRLADDELLAFYVPTRNGQPTVPISGSWYAGLPCKRFEPDFIAQDIACRDKDESPALSTRHRWSLGGKNISQTAVNLERVTGREENGYFVLYKPDAG
jgi:hypothetical protein